MGRGPAALSQVTAPLTRAWCPNPAGKSPGSPQLDPQSRMIRGVELFPVFPVSRS